MENGEDMATIIDFKHAKKSVRRGAGKSAVDHRGSTRKSATGLEGENPNGNTLSEAASAHAPRWGYTFGMYLSFGLAALAFSQGRWIWGTIHVVFFFWSLIARERVDRAVLGPSPHELRTGVHPECGYRHTT
jgi:hypothetical protein